MKKEPNKLSVLNDSVSWRNTDTLPKDVLPTKPELSHFNKPIPKVFKKPTKISPACLSEDNWR
jgi:hypothetical protein